jgi:hypothetical protein
VRVSAQDSTVRKYTVEQRIFIFDSYVKSYSARVCRTKLQQKFPGVDNPARSTIQYRLIDSKLRVRYWIKNKKKTPRIDRRKT